MTTNRMQKRIILCVMTLVTMFFSLSLYAMDKDNFTILSHSPGQIDLRFNLGEWSLESKAENGAEIKSIISNSKHNLYVGEEETLPIFSAMIAIPDGMDVELVSEVTQSRENRNVNLLNRSAMVHDRGSDDLYPQRQIVISEPGQFRDFRVVNINVLPFQYNTRSNDLNVMEQANITLRFVPSRGGYLNSRTGIVSDAFTRLYESLILNYNNLRDELTPIQQPVLLVIHSNYSETVYQSKVAEYISWKKQRGYKVYSASTAAGEAGSSTTTIKNYILNAYNTWEDRPDIVTFIGDESGTIAVPTYSSDYDYGYQLLAGDDQYGDVQIGRISVSNTQDLTNYLVKMYAIERDLNMPTASWLNRMLLVGDWDPSGISTMFTNKYIKEISYAVNPSYTYTELYSASPSTTDMNFAISQGVGFYNYRGYIGMSGWSPSTTSQTNGMKLNHAVIITCGTGNYVGGTSTTEAFVRQGTEAVPSGAVTAIGMATSSTHTGINNCLNIGIFHGIFDRGMRSMGEALLYAKHYTYNVYGVSLPTSANFFTRICNLIGDPTVETYIGIPNTFQITAPTTIVSGTPNLQVVVRNAANNPVANASVNLWQASTGLNLTMYSDASGRAYFDIPNDLAGSILITANKDDFKTLQQSVSVSGTGMVYHASLIDDDSTPPSNGNNNGVVNAGEVIEFRVQVRNTSGVTITNMDATLSHTDPYIQLGFSTGFTFPNATAGSTVTSNTAINFTVSNSCPDYHPVLFTMTLRSSAGTFEIPIRLIVRAADLDYVSHTVVGGNNVLDIGETANFYVTVTNNGSENAVAVYGKLRSLHNLVTVSDSIKYFGNINSGATFSNSGLQFVLTSNAFAIDGMTIPMELILYNSSGYSDTEPFTLTIGNVTQTDPLGQDEYGYFIFDVGDTGYNQCPTYDWIGIAPAEGGSGTLLAITDPRVSNDEGDQVGSDPLEVVDLPFTFKFYGVDYNRITVCSNGFISFGITANHEFRNWRIPGPGGPNSMIAAFWDDLCTVPGSGVYTYHDAAANKFIIEWYNMRNGYDGTSEETFQVILYNPQHYPTATNDGPIKIQYKVFNNVDLVASVYNHGNGCTIGIQDHTGLRGLEYTYNNQYPVAAQPLANQKALYITTAPFIPNEPSLFITQTTLIDTNGNGVAEANETLDVRLTVSNMGTVTASNVSMTISETDPWINITGNSANFGNIGPLGSAVNTSGLIINVLNGCPNSYVATVNAVITCNGFTFERTFAIQISSPDLSFGNVIIQDPTGNNNGRLDPGETVTVIMPLNNIGLPASPAGSATLTSPTMGITVNSGTANFASIPGEGSTNISFNITASSAMPIGTLATLVFNATAGIYTGNKNEVIEVGAPIEVQVGYGTSSQSYPIDRYYNYSVHESIYLSSEIVIAGNIKSIGFYKSGGNDTNPIDAVTIYMKNTTESTLTNAAYSLTGYTQVYASSFPNTSVTGWMEVDLDTLFPYDGVSNLGILILKGYQQYINNYPNWDYTPTATNRARQSRSDTSMPTTLTASNYLPNLKLRVYQVGDVYYPPQNLVATPSHQSVRLEWTEPVSGTPTGYKIFKNGSLLTTTTALLYNDLAVTNGTNYSYYLKAVYSDGESDPTATVNATPNAVAPSNLTANAGNGNVNLYWTGASGRAENVLLSRDERTISGYRVYRNGSVLATVTATTYNDVTVMNEVTYSYYVTTVYVSPAGESSPSNTVQAMPTAAVPVNVILGTGTTMSLTNYISPINTAYRSVHGQAVYTAAELNAAGVFGPLNITQLGLNVGSSPNLALPEFMVRMKHTTDTNVANWQAITDLQTVYTNPAYMPTAGGYDMLTLTTPFVWNGVDNIVIDTAFNLVAEWSHSGTIQYTTITNGYRAAYSDYENQSFVFAGGNTFSRRPNMRLTLQPSVVLNAPEVAIEHISGGCRLSWPAVNGATRYKVYGSANPDTGFSLITETTNTQYIDSAINPCLFYRVIAADGAPARMSITLE